MTDDRCHTHYGIHFKRYYLAHYEVKDEMLEVWAHISDSYLTLHFAPTALPSTDIDVNMDGIGTCFLIEKSLFGLFNKTYTLEPTPSVQLTEEDIRKAFSTVIEI